MNLRLDAEYWSKRYLNNDSGWDTGAVTTPLKTYFDQLCRKDLRILIPGAGNAYEAEYLVNNGFTNVFVCDIAPEPLANLKKRCPDFKAENLLFTDFFKLDQTFDLIVEQTFFCALDPALRKNYFKQAAGLLVPGGKLAGLLFDDVLNADKPPFGGNREEYLSYIDPLLLQVKTLERCYNSIKPREGRELFMTLIKVRQEL